MDLSETDFPLSNQMECDSFQLYFDSESDFMPKNGFYANPAKIAIRRLVVSTIANHWRATDMDAFVPYLAMNYFDRFVSRSPVLDSQIPLVAICCLTIAAKMRTKSFCLASFQEDRSINFTRDTIRTMEVHILDRLGWRMRPVTPFTFLDYFYPEFVRTGGFMRRSINEIIVQAQGEDNFIEYTPSQIAQSSFIAATHIAHPSELSLINQPEELSQCYQGLIDLCRNKDIKIERRSWALLAEMEDQEDQEEETNGAAPKRLMNFDLKWPKIVNQIAFTTSLHEVEVPWPQRCMIS